MALGLNLPDAPTDYDYAVSVQSPSKYNRLVQRLERTTTPSPYNKPYSDYNVFKTDYKGNPVDIALMLGDKGRQQRLALTSAREKLDEEKRQAIVKRKHELKNAWFFPEFRYKSYKRKIDAELGLPKFVRDPIEKLPEGLLKSTDLYGHRTNSIDKIIESGSILSAYDLARKGKLKDYEAHHVGRGRVSEEDLPTEVRKDVFVTKGLLPADSSYGRYGILFRKKKIQASPYINFVPEEYITDKVKSKMTYVVPDDEIVQWANRYPDETFLRESRVPKNLRLNKINITEPVKRFFSGGAKLHSEKGILGKTAAEVLTKLLPHQQRVVDRLREQPGLVVAHGLGTGKTLSSIAAAAEQGGKTTVLSPASLIPNYEKEVAKHLSSPIDMQIRSQQKDSLTGETVPSDLLIVDEAHKARETSTKLNKLLAQYPAAKRMLLTATPVYNRPSDIAPLVNIAAGESVLPVGTTFNERYILKPPKDPSFWYRLRGKPLKPVLQNTKELKGVLQKWVDYQDNTGGDFPTRMDERVRVPMSDIQTRLHAAAWGTLPRSLRKKLEHGVLPTGAELSEFNKFQSQTRQISGSADKYIRSGASPKTMRAVQELSKRIQSDPTSKAIVYSNYLKNLSEYQQQLESQGIPSKLFTGSVPKGERQAAIDDYNTGKLKALLLSSAGGEGLDLKGTRLVQVLEPHWNEEKLDQVIGRAIRHGSHTSLPANKRNVLVQRYITHPQANLWQKITRKDPVGVEDVLADMSKNKKDLNNQLMQLLRRDEVQ